MNLEKLNTLPIDEAMKELSLCCTSTAWSKALLEKRPFETKEDLFAKSDAIWLGLSKDDWLEAFSGHPKIGDVNSLKEKYANTKTLAEGEQAGVEEATEEVLKALSAGNAEYEERFGFIFIVCATGKSAYEMLALLRERFNHDPEIELKNAAEEQNKITKLRLEKLS
jgi:2-oxo-4-hydroxy-4-carboxy-5-ureidoimidazoline decarboxylase